MEPVEREKELSKKFEELSQSVGEGVADYNEARRQSGTAVPEGEFAAKFVRRYAALREEGRIGPPAHVAPCVLPQPQVGLGPAAQLSMLPAPVRNDGGVATGWLKGLAETQNNGPAAKAFALAIPVTASLAVPPANSASLKRKRSRQPCRKKDDPNIADVERVGTKKVWHPKMMPVSLPADPSDASVFSTDCAPVALNGPGYRTLLLDGGGAIKLFGRAGQGTSNTNEPGTSKKFIKKLGVLSGDVMGRYDSMEEAASSMDCCPKRLAHYLKKEPPVIYGGYLWEVNLLPEGPTTVPPVEFPATTAAVDPAAKHEQAAKSLPKTIDQSDPSWECKIPDNPPGKLKKSFTSPPKITCPILPAPASECAIKPPVVFTCALKSGEHIVKPTRSKQAAFNFTEPPKVIEKICSKTGVVLEHFLRIGLAADSIGVSSVSLQYQIRKNPNGVLHYGYVWRRVEGGCPSPNLLLDAVVPSEAGTHQPLPTAGTPPPPPSPSLLAKTPSPAPLMVPVNERTDEDTLVVAVNGNSSGMKF